MNNKSSADLRKENPYLFNSWRAILYTAKGKLAGVDETWRNFKTFYLDTKDEYVPGKRLSRIDKTKPFGPSNFRWVTEQENNNSRLNNIKISYNGETKTIREWANEYGMSVYGIRCRYHCGKNYTNEEILFGKKIKSCKKLTKSPIHIRASKLLSSYKLKDYKRNRFFNLDKNWLITNILTSRCIYCGDTENLGCDRIDNELGHTYENVVPCCYSCNCARNNNFTFEEMKAIGKTIANIKRNRLRK